MWAKALEEYDGRVRYLTNSELSTLGTESPGQTGYVAYQALDKPPNMANDAELKEKFAKDVAAIGLTNVDVVLEKVCFVLCCSSLPCTLTAILPALNCIQCPPHHPDVLQAG